MIFARPSIVSALLFSSFVFSTLARPSHSSTAYPGFDHPSNGDCKDYLVNSTVTYSQLHWNETLYKNNYDVASLLSKVATQGKVPFAAFSHAQNVTKTFRIAGTFCKPKGQKAGKESTVLVATHGAGFDRRYWASSFEPENYNFAQYALGAGYSVFYYDRPGVGLSSRISGYELEVNLQVEVLAALLRALRNGDYTLGAAPSKLVLVGHSFGSSISNFVLQRHPELAEAAVLTGFAFPNATDPAAFISGLGLSVFAARIVSTLPEAAKPQFAETFDDGWLSFGDKYAFTESFLGAEDYDVSAAEYAFKIAQPYSAVDFLSVFVQMGVADRFQGKLLFAPAERDLFFCGGDCKDTFARGVQGQAFPLLNATDVSLYVQEASGHGQNFASNAKDMYAAVVSFVDGL